MMTDLNNPTVLRSHLVYHVGGELSNITVADLEECKWSVKKIIFLNLISKSPPLNDIKESLDRIQEHRSRELKQLKLSQAVREERVESEKIYRSRFIRCVVMGLEKLEFPPAIAPFADLATDLFEEVQLVRSAMAFLLEVGVGLKYELYSAPTSSSSSNARQKSLVSTSPTSRNMETSPVTIPHSASSVTDTTNVSRNTDVEGESELPGMSELEVSAISFNSDGIDLGLPSAPIVGMNSSMFSGVNNSLLGSDHTKSRHSQNANNTTNATITSMNTTSNSKNLRNRNSNTKNEVIERLQSQNEYLTQQLSVLMQAVSKKEEAEFKMSMIFRDLCAILDDLTPNTSKDITLTVTPTLDDPTPNTSKDIAIKDLNSNDMSKEILPLGYPDQAITKEEYAVYREEIARAEQRDKHPLATGSEKNNNDRIKKGTNTIPRSTYRNSVSNTNASSNGSKGMWRSISQKVHELKNQWEQTRRSASATTQVPLGQHADSDYCPKASTLLLRSILGVYSGGSVNGSAHSSDKSDKYGYITSPTSYTSSNTNTGVEHDAPLVGLDLKRIHGLQRTLVQLADNALIISEDIASSSSPIDAHDDIHNTINTASEKSGIFTIWNGFDSSPRNNNSKIGGLGSKSRSISVSQSQSESQYETIQNAMTQFVTAAQTMLLETAALAPVAAVSRFTGNGNHNDSLVGSGLCGLEAIEAVVRDLPPNTNRDRSLDRGGVGMRIALDRAWNEQAALGRCLGVTQSMLKQWTKAAHKCRMALSRLGDNSLKSLQKGIKKLNKVEEAGEAIFTALQAAENVKKTDLDALARGTHGVEIASLIHALRMYCHELSNSSSDLNSVKYELSQAWGVEKKEMDRLNESLNQASIRSEKAAGLTVKMLTGGENKNDIHSKYNRRKGNASGNSIGNSGSSTGIGSRPRSSGAESRPRSGKTHHLLNAGINTSSESTLTDDRPPWVD